MRYLDSEVLQGASDFIASQGQDYTQGDPLLNVPEHSASVWTTYDLSRQWQLGYGASYQGEYWISQHSATNPDGPLADRPGVLDAPRDGRPTRSTAMPRCS